MKRIVLAIILILGVAFWAAETSFADLIEYDWAPGLVYDSELNLTWLKDANYAYTSGHVDILYGGASWGWMYWNDAMEWADNLVYESGGVIYDDWRLPKNLPINSSDYEYTFSYDGSTDHGYNITSPNCEMAYMFYVNLGNKGYYDSSRNPQADSGVKNIGPFINLQEYDYWYRIEYAPQYPDAAWTFFFRGGSQSVDWKTDSTFAWAVRDGAPINPVPEPSTLLLLGSAFLLGAAFRKRSRK